MRGVDYIEIRVEYRPEGGSVISCESSLSKEKAYELLQVVIRRRDELLAPISRGKA